MPTIAGEIEDLDLKIRRGEDRLDNIERTLRLSSLSEKERFALEEEESALEKDLEDYRHSMKSLRKENFKSAVASCLLLVFIYSMYVVLWS